jgi:hypothetical protein
MAAIGPCFPSHAKAREGENRRHLNFESGSELREACDLRIPWRLQGLTARCHEVDFGSSPLRVEVHAGEETVEIHIEADFDTLAENRRRFAIVSMSRQQFSEATGAAARRAAANNLRRKRLP